MHNQGVKLFKEQGVTTQVHRKEHKELKEDAKI
jgi:hypothetical protein